MRRADDDVDSLDCGPSASARGSADGAGQVGGEGGGGGRGGVSRQQGNADFKDIPLSTTCFVLSPVLPGNRAVSRANSHNFGLILLLVTSPSQQKHFL